MMAKINHLISLGIGSPADIGYSVRYGLGPGYLGTIELTLPERDITQTLENRNVGLTLHERDISLLIDDEM